MQAQAVVPTIRGREDLLSATVRSLEQHGIDPVVVQDSPSCGEGWMRGLAACTARFVLLAADDIEVGDLSSLHTACRRADAGLIVSPVILNIDRTLQGAGGSGLKLVDGALARNTIFPFAHRETFATVSPWPASNHYCDSWITERAWKLGRGPIVTEGFELIHKLSSEIGTDEVPMYNQWRSRALNDISRVPMPLRRRTSAVLRAHQGGGGFVAGPYGRIRTELRLFSASPPVYVARSPRRVRGAWVRGFQTGRRVVSRKTVFDALIRARGFIDRSRV